MSSGTKEGNQQDSSSQTGITGPFQIIILALIHQFCFIEPFPAC
ncbi:hypothetical protein [Methanosarcina sp.]|nr:hypothetical protein [Methanosarcina sp.]MDY9926327.1 hypothetical protein [Methanosarcina sp.]